MLYQHDSGIQGVNVAAPHPHSFPLTLTAELQGLVGEEVAGSY